MELNRIQLQGMRLQEWSEKVPSVPLNIYVPRLDGTISLTSAKITRKPVFVGLVVSGQFSFKGFFLEKLLFMFIIFV